MPITELFVRPTVQSVIFEVKFPNLFYMKDRIGDLQMRILKEFPESALLYRRQLLFADIGPEGKMQELPADLDKEGGKRIWQFISKKGFRLNVQSDSLDITSEYHKTYNLEGGGAHRFRAIIESVLKDFLDVTQIPFFGRVGLRYVDKCPVPDLKRESFASWYNTSFPLDRFELAKAAEMDFRVLLEKGDGYFVHFRESLRREKSETTYYLDFDGFKTDIESNEVLKHTDKLHELISTEYDVSIKEPLKIWMRTTENK